MCKQDLSSDCKCLPPVRDAGGGWGIKKKKGGGGEGESERARRASSCREALLSDRLRRYKGLLS